MRRYVEAKIQMIADDHNSPLGMRAFLEQALRQVLHDTEILGAGEVGVWVAVYGKVQVNEQGYAIPWPEEAK